MRLKEQRLWDRMRNNVGATVRLERIENLAGNGIPDVFGLRAGRVTFVELKCAALLPKRATTRLLGGDGLNVDQRNWHLSWRNDGGRSLIVVGVDGLPLHWVLTGEHADAVNDMTTRELDEAALLRMNVRREAAVFWSSFGALF